MSNATILEKKSGIELLKEVIEKCEKTPPNNTQARCVLIAHLEARKGEMLPEERLAEFGNRIMAILYQEYKIWPMIAMEFLINQVGEENIKDFLAEKPALRIESCGKNGTHKFCPKCRIINKNKLKTEPWH